MDAEMTDASPLDARIAPHLDVLKASALRLTRSAHDADELVQDTLVTAVAGIGRLRNDDLAGAWLQQILRSKWIDLIRRRASERRAMEQVRPGSPVREADDLVHRAMAVLGSEERRIVELRYFHSRNSSEIAEILGKPPGTVRSLLFHALSKFEAEYRRLGRTEES
jgi:RNA polymerase sigma-70 factor (ECF subfamily)